MSTVRTRGTAAAVVVALIAIYGALPCLALAASSGPMGDGMPMASCDAGNAQTAGVLCSAPTAYTPVSVSPALPLPDSAITPAATLAPPAAIVTGLHAPPEPSPPPRATRVFLLHASLLI